MRKCLIIFNRNRYSNLFFLFQIQIGMAESEGFIPIEKKLSELFKEAFDFFLKINDSTEPTNSLEFQVSFWILLEDPSPE